MSFPLPPRTDDEREKRKWFTSISERLKTVDSSTISAADSKGVSSGVLASSANSAAISNSINVSVADSKGASSGLKASTADSKTTSNSINISVAGSKGVSAGLRASTSESLCESRTASLSTNLSSTESKVVSAHP